MSDQTKRVRSPNYPAISLPQAIEKLKPLFERINKHAAPKEAIAKAFGYGGWNGTSASMISAHTKYGLLDRSEGDKFKITDRAMRIMFGKNPTETEAAIREAAIAPPLYAALADEFGETPPHDDILLPLLIRRGFAPTAVSAVIQSYRETMGLLRPNAEVYDSEAKHDGDESAPPPGLGRAAAGPQAPLLLPILQSSPGRQEKIADDDGNEIILTFPSEPTIETYEFVKEYLEFRINRLQKTLKQKLDELA